MKRALIAALLVAGCSSETAVPGNDAAPSTTATPSPAASPSPSPATAGNLVGASSALKADISGLSVRTSDTRVIVDLPADTLFEFDRADLTSSASDNLVKVAELIRSAPAGSIEVAGYTDAKGDDSYNLALSERRAQAVVNWMREQVGVRQRAFEVVGKGEADPVASNARPDGSDDPEGRAKNRRVVVSIPR